ncbi:MAG: hypothetical protein Q4D06_04940 [Coriobacteriia bacterium]|nr:hypothetical protein [Coriobacteriia bacterium]
MIDVLIIAILAVMALGAGAYLYRQKRRGATCVGCPHAGACAEAGRAAAQADGSAVGAASGCSCGCGCSQLADALENFAQPAR